MKEIKEFLQPLLLKVLEAVTVETVEDWACCLTNISVIMYYINITRNLKCKNVYIG